MAVYISGAVLSSLMYDQTTNEGDQYGFLVGEVNRQLTDTISDSQINNVEVETRLNVYDTVPCPKDRKFYNSRGEILLQSITDLLKDKNKTVVGWYSFRRNSPLRPSFRERLLHENLARCLATDHGGGASSSQGPSNMFTFLLCSARSCTNRSTHTLDHRFLHLSNNVFHHVPVTIVNLGDTTHTEYRAVSSQTVSSTQGVYNLILHQHQQEFLNEHNQVDVRRIQALNSSLNRKLEGMLPDVLKSETRLSELEAEVIKYRRLVRLKRGVPEQPASGISHTPSVAKAPSVDDILFMDIDEDMTPTYGEQIQAHQVGREGLDSVDNRPIATKNTKEEHDQMDISSLPHLHDRVTSLNKDKTRSETNFSKSLPVISDAKKKKSSDPFEFVSGILAESKHDEKQEASPNPLYMSVKDGGEVRLPSSVNKPEDVNKPDHIEKAKQQRETKDKSSAFTSMDKNTEYRYRTKGNMSTDPASKRTNLRSKGVPKEIVVDDADVQRMETGHDGGKVSHSCTDGGKVSHSCTDGGKVSHSSTGATRSCSQEADGAMEDEEGVKSSPDTYSMDSSASPVF